MGVPKKVPNPFFLIFNFLGTQNFRGGNFFAGGRHTGTFRHCLCNSGRFMVDLAAEQCSTILNCSRDYMFVNVCVEIVESQGLNLKRKINLSKR